MTRCLTRSFCRGACVQLRCRLGRPGSMLPRKIQQDLDCHGLHLACFDHAEREYSS